MSAKTAAFWSEFCQRVHLAPDTPQQTWHFGNTPAMAHSLVELVLRGPKRATAMLASAADADPSKAPITGGYSVVTEADGTPRAIVRTTQVDRRAFRDVDAQFAWDEGEGDRTLADWRDGHWRYFSRECEAAGDAMSEDRPVVLERFELLYPFDAALDPVDCGPRLIPACLPGAMSESAALQIACYTRDFNFSSAFEYERLRDIAQFVETYDAGRDGVWLVVSGGRVLGSIVVDARADVPELRWFIVDPSLRGGGWGRRLMASAMAHCRVHHARVVLHTFSALQAARGLYEAFGFRQFGGEAEYSGWGPTIVDQHFEWVRS